MGGHSLFITTLWMKSRKPLQHDVVLLNLDDFQDMDIILILKVNKLLVTTTHQWWMKGRLKLFVKKLLMYFNISLTLMFSFKSIIRITICWNLQIFSSALFLNYYQIHSWFLNAYSDQTIYIYTDLLLSLPRTQGHWQLGWVIKSNILYHS